MSRIAPSIITLEEYKPLPIRRAALSHELGRLIWREYGSQIAVEFPSPKTKDSWQLTSRGWVGLIPLDERLSLSLQPKVPLTNLFRMLEWAYNLDDFHFLEGLIACQSLDDLYQRLAHILARRVLDRKRKGLYRAYLPEQERLPFVRGRLDLQAACVRPWEACFPCDYENHTADVEDNQLLAWTLWCIMRSGICGETVLAVVRQAFLQLRGVASLVRLPSSTCIKRLYNRLNDDYHPMHALCRFFLDNMGPSHRHGDRTMLPFLVNMGRLYELFIARWLIEHLPPRLRLNIQEWVSLDPVHPLRLKIDLVLLDATSGQVLCVMDTKYKKRDHPRIKDINQIVTYAAAKNCRQAFLINPEPLTHPLNITVGEINVRSLRFGLTGDLDQRGAEFLSDLQNLTNPPAVPPVLH